MMRLGSIFALSVTAREETGEGGRGHGKGGEFMAGVNE